MKLPISTLIVDIISVEHEASDRQDYLDRNGRNISRHTDSSVATGRIREVIETDHQLKAGAVIKIRYDTVTYRPRMPGLRADVGRGLSAGETVTITVFRDRDLFRWRK